jgi:hypothetical protein
MAKLTTRSLATGASVNDLIHIVITGDTSQSIDGSSYKATLSQIIPLFGGSSGNCITNFYTNNIHACLDEITIHNRVQSVGSDAQNTLSFAFGNNTQALSNYTHAEGSGTIASGSTSHAEGSNTKAFGLASHSEGSGTTAGINKAYLVTGLTSGVAYLSNIYGDVTTNFTTGEHIYINDVNYGNTLTETYGKVSGATFSISQGGTRIYFTDTSLSTSSSCLIGDTNHPTSWGGNMTVGGINANAKNNQTSAIGENSLSTGNLTAALGTNSSSFGKNNKVYGRTSAIFGSTNNLAGTSSFVFGDTNTLYASQSIVVGSNNTLFGDTSFAGGSSNIINGQTSFVFGQQNTTNNEQGAILGGNNNLVQSGSTENSTITGGRFNTITGLAPSDPVYDSAIIGGSGNTVNNAFRSVIIGGEGNTISSGSRSIVLGGTGITATLSNTVYVPNIVLAYSGTPTSSSDTLGQPGSLLWDNSYFYYKDNTGWKRISGATW